ncbi:hypothetical protein N7533_013553 [Penicillium manginii]|jgi:hypothetical protein|uniref:uncharacterized protein n=1 Tax=Penicillium manginii TaxID=203109 RepID=UPI002547514B|nr:uncharacterized protein N7533_013553 [Penicillium manginii]KAJ5733106.1 hypothetical protein N7533_013553 [Penicillium manginii]
MSITKTKNHKWAKARASEDVTRLHRTRRYEKHYDYTAIAVDQAKCRKVSAGRLAKWWETGASVEGSLSTGDDPQLNGLASLLGSDQTTEVDKIGSWPA